MGTLGTKGVHLRPEQRALAAAVPRRFGHYDTRFALRRGLSDREGFAIGSIEGRVGIHHVDPKNAHRNFAFKCHRETQDARAGQTGSCNIYAVNSIAFHHLGTFANAFRRRLPVEGGLEQRLMQFKKAAQTIGCSRLSARPASRAYGAVLLPVARLRVALSSQIPPSTASTGRPGGARSRSATRSRGARDDATHRDPGSGARRRASYAAGLASASPAARRGGGDRQEDDPGGPARRARPSPRRR